MNLANQTSPIATKPVRLSVKQHAARSATAMLDRIGYLKLRFQKHRALRIVCYHGICADEVANEPWIPSYFVSAGDFANHLRIMKRFGPVVHLPEMLCRLDRGTANPEACIAVTFDDVAACTFENARPVLADQGVKATFFVASGHATSSRLFNADVIDLARLNPGLVPTGKAGPLARLLCRPAEHKRMRLDELCAVLDEPERILRKNIDPVICETLRPMNWLEIRQLAADGHDIGGHTVDHSILGYQLSATRRSQITECVADIEREIGKKPIAFAYPNGGPGDFDATDRSILDACGIRYAGSTRAGFCIPGTDRFALPRVCIVRAHSAEKFAMEMSGLLDKRRGRQHGWL